MKDSPWATPRLIERAAPLPYRLQVAAVFLLMNAGALVLETLIAGEGRPTGIGAAAIDVWIAWGFLGGDPKRVNLSLVRVSLGFALFFATSIATDLPWLIPVGALYFGGMLLILVGEPTRARIHTGAALCAIYGLFEVVGLAFS